MKSKPLIVILAALALSGCEEKHQETRNELHPMEERHQGIRNELLLIQRTTSDTTQPDYIRESAVIFEKILREENDIPFDDWIRACSPHLRRFQHRAWKREYALVTAAHISK